jgi:hypothetical protein
MSDDTPWFGRVPLVWDDEGVARLGGLPPYDCKVIEVLGWRDFDGFDFHTPCWEDQPDRWDVARAVLYLRAGGDVTAMFKHRAES